MLFNEPKLLKLSLNRRLLERQRRVSVLFNEPKLLKSAALRRRAAQRRVVSVLFNEPKLLKFNYLRAVKYAPDGFSALQRAEIAEMLPAAYTELVLCRFSALQRAEIAEILSVLRRERYDDEFQCSSTSRNC